MSVPAGKYGNMDSSSNPDERARHQYQISAQNSERQSYFVAWLQAIYGLLCGYPYLGERETPPGGGMHIVSPLGVAIASNDSWYPWSSDAPEGEKNSREGNESELESRIRETRRGQASTKGITGKRRAPDDIQAEPHALRSGCPKKDTAPPSKHSRKRTHAFKYERMRSRCKRRDLKVHADTFIQN
ncbi:hypothetical protein EV421DRAFT_1743478 [Armillaria borealis]|uniref:Uncharacterized protein n=1 Tax=Armillaria borealis TaxID=47425 RepID=A0AA39IY70_9AGAR|nr:hypothetical protein EV421DRAFT_1743478 [Armillaria borealis]